MEFDTVATGISGGIEVLPIALSATDSFSGILSDIEGKVQPGQTLTIAGTSASSNEVRVGVTWKELH